MSERRQQTLSRGLLSGSWMTLAMIDSTIASDARIDGATACRSPTVSPSAGAAVKAFLMAINNIRRSGQESIIAGRPK